MLKQKAAAAAVNLNPNNSNNNGSGNGVPGMAAVSATPGAGLGNAAPGLSTSMGNVAANLTGSGILPNNGTSGMFL